MSLFDSLKKQAVKAVLKTSVAQQVVPLVTEALRKAEGASVEVLSSPAYFRTRVSNPSYARLPMPVQALLSPEQWHDVMFSLKDQWFMVQDGKLRLQPEFHASLQAFVQQLLYGKKGADRRRASQTTIRPQVIDVAAGDETKKDSNAR